MEVKKSIEETVMTQVTTLGLGRRGDSCSEPIQRATLRSGVTNQGVLYILYMLCPEQTEQPRP